MRSYLLANHRDKVIEMRLAGIEGEAVKNKVVAKKSFQQAVHREGVGILIVTETVQEWLKEEIMEHKINVDRPLIVTVPDRDRLRESDFIMKFIKESVGIKVD